MGGGEVVAREIDNIVLTDWFARKNRDDTVIFTTIFITITNQVCSLTNKFFPSNL